MEKLNVNEMQGLQGAVISGATYCEMRAADARVAFVDEDLDEVFNIMWDMAEFGCENEFANG